MSIRRSGMTLVEVLLAAMLLGLGMMTIFSGLTRCLSLIRASRDVQKMHLVFDLGNLAHPMDNIQSEEDFSELEVDPPEDIKKILSILHEDGERSKGLENYLFSRKVDTKVKPENDNEFNDHLFTIRTVVSWGEGDDAREEIVELVWLPNIDEWTGGGI